MMNKRPWANGDVQPDAIENPTCREMLDDLTDCLKLARDQLDVTRLDKHSFRHIQMHLRPALRLAREIEEALA